MSLQLKNSLLPALLVALFMPLTAQAQSTQKKEWPVLSLKRDNIQAFMDEVKSVSTGKQNGMSESDIAAYLDRHIANTGQFNSLTKFEIPGLPVKESPMSFNKEQYISNILQGQSALENYQSTVEIKDLQISMNGKTASLKTTSREKGLLDWPDAEGTMKKVPVEGLSDCVQNLSISEEQAIVMMNADCQTTIRFQAFTKPIGEN